MLTPRADFETWLHSHVEKTFPDLVQPIALARDVFDRSLLDGFLTAESLSVLTTAARSNRVYLRDTCAEMLGTLAGTFPAAYDAVRMLTLDSSVQARLGGLVALGTMSTGQLHEEALTSCIHDRSKKIRVLAAAMILERQLRSMLPELEAALTREVDPKVRSALTRHRDLLRDGYAATRLPDGRLDLIFTIHGTGLIGSVFSLQEIEAKGLDRIARDLGADPPRSSLHLERTGDK